MYNPYDHYWDNGIDVFSSKTQTRVAYSDSAYQAWLAKGNVATKDPGNGLLREVLRAYEIGLTPAETAEFVQDHADIATLKAAYQNILADLNTITDTITPPLTNTQRDQAIQALAAHMRTLLKGLKLLYRKFT